MIREKHAELISLLLQSYYYSNSIKTRGRKKRINTKTSQPFSEVNLGTLGRAINPKRENAIKRSQRQTKRLRMELEMRDVTQRNMIGGTQELGQDG